MASPPPKPPAIGAMEPESPELLLSGRHTFMESGELSDGHAATHCAPLRTWAQLLHSVLVGPVQPPLHSMWQDMAEVVVVAALDVELGEMQLATGVQCTH